MRKSKCVTSATPKVIWKTLQKSEEMDYNLAIE